MFNNIKKEKFSLRKYKNGRTDSKLIGAITILGIAMLAGGGTASANVSSGAQNETTLVSKFEKVSSSAKTTFTDDQNPAKKVTVDAVADIRYNRPAKANQNTGNVDGTDSIKFESNATVNYLLEDDNSTLKDSKKVAGEEGIVSTPYDKKGIAYDTDGKDYRESTVEKTGTAIDEDTGKEAVIQANNKEYKWIRSEVVDANKATYDKTKFNDIEAPVSPEGMHNNLGEINYGKITGKVYLVEETSDGHYGKFVEASGVSSDEDAVAKWKNGQATAKDFTKENVTLKEGDTVLVMDRDTYAHGSGTRTVNTVKYRREKIPAKPSYNYTEGFNRTEGIPGKPTYAFWMQPKTGEFPTIGDDYIFGTADDGKVNFKDENILYYNNIYKNLPPGITGSNKYNFKNESLQEILEEMHAQINGILDYFDRNVNNEADKKRVLARREELKQNIAKTIEMIKQNQIKVAVEDERGLMFSQGNQEILKKLRDQIEGAQSVLSDLEITLGTSKETLKEYNQLKDVELTTKEVLKYSEKYGFASGVIKSYHKDKEEERYSDWEKVNPEVETREGSVYANKGAVTISDDLSNINVVNENSTTNETEFTKKDVTTKEETNYVVKEIITPVRAYKVMEEGESVVNHYYRLSTKLSDAPVKIENTKVGSVSVNYESESGEILKESEVLASNVPYEKVKTYDVLSGSTKVGEEKVTENLEPTYDATAKRYKTILGDKTGFTYEYLGLKEGSAPEEGIINKEKTQVTYIYRLVTKEDPKPKAKEVLGSVVVRYVDAEGNEIKQAETLVKDAVLRATYTYTTRSGDKVVSTREVVKEFTVQDYSTKEKLVEKITTADGKTYKYHGVYPVSTKFNNVTAETGKVVEGVTTVVYQYDYDIPVKPTWQVPSDAPKNEVPEYEGGVSPIEPPVLEVPEFNGGASSIEPPVLEVPEYEGGVSPIEPPVLEVPEFNGGVPSDRPTILEVPEYRGSLVKPIPNPKEKLQALPTVEDLEESIVTLSTENRKKSERLPNTGDTSLDATALGFMSMLAALVMSVRKRRKEK
ncbi:MAG: LPXTG cell wall anchor domain-containing protein [Gemella haemolysans]|uniref:SIALI-17 repeat-containing surface protein n=1 Tax=Gemella haemolysans TaxID=1379 RepID=UPI002915A57F|nr:SIALI-17 repeat-containing surface protein [Gemella haemolysans]MDU6573103.1 LPXTG cell wall anchor domain-containing protein [Gemella haemolysans]